MRTRRSTAPIRYAATSVACLLAATLTAGRLDAQHGHRGHRHGHATVRPPAGVVRDRIRVRVGTRRLHDHSFGHGGRRARVVIVPFAYPYYLYGPYGVAQPRYLASPYYPRTVTRVAGQPESQTVAADSSLVVEQISTTVLRLTWLHDGRAAEIPREVRLFLADGEEQVLALQAVHAAPFTALFDANARAAYAGVRVVYADGRRSTTLLPLQPRR
jgi:hypothetical protein